MSKLAEIKNTAPTLHMHSMSIFLFAQKRPLCHETSCHGHSCHSCVTHMAVNACQHPANKGLDAQRHSGVITKVSLDENHLLSFFNAELVAMCLVDLTPNWPVALSRSCCNVCWQQPLGSWWEQGEARTGFADPEVPEVHCIPLENGHLGCEGCFPCKFSHGFLVSVLDCCSQNTSCNPCTPAHTCPHNSAEWQE